MSIDNPIYVGEVVALSNTVFRLTAPNPSSMTGPGTNTYIVGSKGDYAVIDPGPVIDSHIEALLAFVGSDLKRIIVTHTHSDHSPAAAVVKQKTGAECYGLQAVGELALKFQDETFAADHVLGHDDKIVIAGESLRVLYTPGHVNNHLCFLLEQQEMLFSGDHIMQGSTVAIVPPQGSMRDYLHSLRYLLDEPIRAIAPAHGVVIQDPKAEIEKLIAHRTWREKKTLQFLSTSPQKTTELLACVYDDVPLDMHWAAKLSLFAHLEKLKEEKIITSSFDLVLDSHEAIARLDEVQWQLV